MKAERYYAIERELRYLRDVVCDMLAANPKLPLHITEPLGRRLIDATTALSLPEDLK